VPVLPNRPFAMRWCCSTFSGIIAPEGMPQRRMLRHYMPQLKRSVEKNIVRVSHEIKIKQMGVMECLFLLIICDEYLVRPRGG